MTNRTRDTKITDGQWGLVREEEATSPNEERLVYRRVVIATDGIWSRCRHEIYSAIHTGIMRVAVSVVKTSQGQRTHSRNCGRCFLLGSDF